jgi:hypothetical protein
MKQINFIQLLLIPVLLVSFAFIFITSSYASCTIPATCDAPPGECGPTCNGGGQCIIANGFYTTVCVNKTEYDPCSSIEIAQAISIRDSYPYPSCGDFSSCDCSDGSKATLVQDCSGDTVSYKCLDSQVANCCTPGTPSTCGDGTCDTAAGETSTSCASDCGASTWCGDGFCNGTENSSTCLSDCPVTPYCGDGSCNNGENNASCPGDCPSVGAYCGDGFCNGSDTCSNCSADCGACPYCGDGSCAGSETCSSCALDCSSCDEPFCGDFSCDAFESCSTCASDCGSCPENEAWFQISAGHVGSANDGNASLAIQSKITEAEDCVAPNCIRSLLTQDLDRTTLTDGFAVIGSGTIDANGLISGERSENIYSSNTTKSRYQEKYEFFYRNSGLGISPTSDFTGTASDALKPTYNSSKIAYFQNDDLRIESPWSVAAGETYVIFVDGNLTLADGDGASDQLIDVANGGFIAFIVSGNITFDESLGNSTLSETTANVEGVFIADGTLTFASRGVAAGGDDRFVGEGSFIGWSGVNLDRDFSDGVFRDIHNNDKATELFIYRPDFLVNMPDIMLVPIRIWQETN